MNLVSVSKRTGVFFCLSLCLGVASLQKNCCAPKQWTGVVTQRVGRYDRTHDQASISEMVTRYAYDAKNMKTAAISHVDNFTSQEIYMETKITDYNKKKEYTIVDESCTVVTIKEEIPSNCIPDNAVHLGLYNISGPSVNMFFIQTGGGGQTRKSVTYNSCLPVTESVLTSGPDYFLKTSVYENVTSGIPDPSVFNIPSICPQESSRVHRHQASRENVESDDTLYFKSKRTWDT